MSPTRAIAQAPGRVNLIGEHTDYNDGFALPMALPFGTTIRFEPRQDDTVVLKSVGFRSTSFVSSEPDPEIEPWARYVAGMFRFLREDGLQIGGFDAHIETTIPVGASLSSSAALEVATGFGLCAMVGVDPDPIYISRLGQRVENEIIGIQSGIMDQLISAVAVEGTATMIDCRSLETTPVKIPGSAQVVIMDTMTRRELADSEYDLRRASCERAAAALGVNALRDASLADVASLAEGVDKRRAQHVVSENARVANAVDAFAVSDLTGMGTLMRESHRSLSVDYEVSSDALDLMALIANEHEACFGARMTGGGFAGSAVALIDSSSTSAFFAHVRERWKSECGVDPDLWAVHPSDGASAQLLGPT